MGAAAPLGPPAPPTPTAATAPTTAHLQSPAVVHYPRPGGANNSYLDAARRGAASAPTTNNAAADRRNPNDNGRRNTTDIGRRNHNDNGRRNHKPDTRRVVSPNTDTKPQRSVRTTNALESLRRIKPPSTWEIANSFQHNEAFLHPVVCSAPLGAAVKYVTNIGQHACNRFNKLAADLVQPQGEWHPESQAHLASQRDLLSDAESYARAEWHSLPMVLNQLLHQAEDLVRLTCTMKCQHEEAWDRSRNVDHFYKQSLSMHNNFVAEKLEIEQRQMARVMSNEEWAAAKAQKKSDDATNAKRRREDAQATKPGECRAAMLRTEAAREKFLALKKREAERLLPFTKQQTATVEENDNVDGVAPPPPTSHAAGVTAFNGVTAFDGGHTANTNTVPPVEMSGFTAGPFANPLSGVTAFDGGHPANTNTVPPVEMSGFTAGPFANPLSGVTAFDGGHPANTNMVPPVDMSGFTAGPFANPLSDVTAFDGGHTVNTNTRVELSPPAQEPMPTLKTPKTTPRAGTASKAGVSSGKKQFLKKGATTDRLVLKGFKNNGTDCFLTSALTLLSAYNWEVGLTDEANPQMQARRALAEAIAAMAAGTLSDTDSAAMIRSLRQLLVGLNIVETMDMQEDIFSVINAVCRVLVPGVFTSFGRVLTAQDPSERLNINTVTEFDLDMMIGSFCESARQCKCGTTYSYQGQEAVIHAHPPQACTLAEAALYASTEERASRCTACDCDTVQRDTLVSGAKLTFMNMNFAITNDTPIKITPSKQVVIGDNVFSLRAWAKYIPSTFDKATKVANGGHYVSYVLDTEGINVMNDDKSHRLPLSELEKQEGHIFLLLREDPSRAQPSEPTRQRSVNAASISVIKRPAGAARTTAAVPVVEVAPTAPESFSAGSALAVAVDVGQSLSRGRGGAGNLASCGDVEVNPGPKHPLPQSTAADAANHAASNPFAAAPGNEQMRVFDSDDEEGLLFGRLVIHNGAPDPASSSTDSDSDNIGTTTGEAAFEVTAEVKAQIEAFRTAGKAKNKLFNESAFDRHIVNMLNPNKDAGKYASALKAAEKKLVCGCKDWGSSGASGTHLNECCVMLSRKHLARNGTTSSKGTTMRTRVFAHVNAQPDPIAPTALGAMAAAGSFVPPIPTRELWLLHLTPVSHIPRQALRAVAAAATAAFSTPAYCKWWMITAFGRLVLSRPLPGTSVVSAIRRRAADFQNMKWAPLLEEARAIHAHNVKVSAERGEQSAKDSTITTVDDPSKFSPYDITDELFERDSDENSVTARARRNCVVIAQQGCISKAMAALSPSPICPWSPEVFASMEKKHPPAGSPVPSALLQQLRAVAPPREATVSEVVRCLRGFPPRSSGGPGGMTPSMLLSLATFPGSAFAAPLAAAVTDIVSDQVPLEYIPFVFGAKLIALKKKDGGLRPIACSETLRRLAAKLLASRHAATFANILKRFGQIGVAIPCGLEALAAWARRTALQLREGHIVAKIDFANAFNSVERRIIIEAALSHVPDLSCYVNAAYSHHSLLFCGAAGTISSEVGVQQGDPLGPVLFSLAALHCVDLPEELRKKLRGTGWYLDDGLLVGDAADVKAALDHIKTKGEEIGLVMNTSKTEILTDHPDTWPVEYRTSFPYVRPLREFELLGLPCSPHESGIQQYIDKFLDRVQQRTQAIADVGSLNDPHVGYLLLRMCTGFAACVHLARAIGPIPEFAAIDDEVRKAMCRIVNLDDRAQAIARLPFRLGGLGLRAVAEHAAAAMIAQNFSTAALMPLFSSAPLPIDPLFARMFQDDVEQSLQAPKLLRVELPKIEKNAAAQVTKPDQKLQRKLSVIVDNDIAASLDFDLTEQARATSCSAQGASLFLVGPMPQDDTLRTEFFFGRAAFETAIRMRLGMPVRAEPGRCALCIDKDAAHELDVYGNEAACCMRSGMRTRLHHGLRDRLHRMLSEALLAPRREVAVDAKSAQRLDISAWLGGVHYFLDVAITHPLQKRDGAALAAAAAPGGWSTAYEEKKRVHYSEVFGQTKSSTPTHLQLVPFIVDSFGAMGDSAADFVKRLVPLFASRRGLSHTVASRIVRGRLTTCVVRGMAELVAQA